MHLTMTTESILCQLIAGSAGACERSNCVDAHVLAVVSPKSLAFIGIYIEG